MPPRYDQTLPDIFALRYFADVPEVMLTEIPSRLAVCQKEIVTAGMASVLVALADPTKYKVSTELPEACMFVISRVAENGYLFFGSLLISLILAGS